MATYYVASSGNDGNSGASGAPWLTLAYAVTQLSDGDRLLINRGDTFSEILDLSSLNNITVSVYGTGIRPTVGAALTGGLLIGADSDNNVEELVLIGGGAGNGGDTAVIGGTNNTLRDCYVLGGDDKCVLLTSANRCTVERCEMLLPAASAQGVTCFQSAKNTICHNWIQVQGTSSTGVYAHGSGSTGNVVALNLIENTSGLAPTLQSLGVYEDSDGAGNTMIRHNWIRGWFRFTARLLGSGIRSVYGNIIDSRHKQDGTTVLSMSNGTLVRIYANTIYGVKDAASDFVTIGSTNVDHVVRNNIVLNTGNTYYMSNDLANCFYKGDYNYFNLGTRARPFNANAPTPNTNETFANHQIHVAPSDANSAEADPQLFSLSEGYFWPASSSSPVIEAGESIEGYDMRLSPDSIWPFRAKTVTSTSIGAYSGPKVKSELQQPGLSSPYDNAVAVTPSDSTDLATTCRAIYIGGGGNVSVDLADTGTAQVLSALDAGKIYRVRAARIRSTGTTATNIVALW